MLHPPTFAAALGAVLALGLLAEFSHLVGPDIGFLLYAALRVTEGARLYVDVVEINPPLVILLNVPAVVAARWLGASEILVYRVGFALVLLVLLGTAARRLRLAEPQLDPPVRRWLVLLLAVVYFLLPREAFGQREHLVLALLVPYLLLGVARAEGRAVGRGSAILVGGLAGTAMALKPHFLPVWLGVEGYLRLVPGRRRVDPETIAIALVLAGYGLAVLLFVPAYLEMLGLVSGAYLNFLYDPIPHLLLTAPGVAITYVSLLSYVALRPRAGHPYLWDVLTVGVTACLLAGLLQQKGLRYHFLPSFGLGLTLLGLIAADLRRPLGSWVRRVYRVIAGGALATTALVTGCQAARDGLGVGSRPEEDARKAMIALVGQRARGEAILVLSYHIGSTYPLVNYTGAKSALRFPQLWILPAEYLDALHAPGPLRFRNPAEMRPSERFMRESVVADFEAHDPRLLIVLRNARDVPENGFRRLDYLAYFQRDPKFARLTERYQLLAAVGEYLVYERLAEGVTRTAPAPAPTPSVADVRLEDRGDLKVRLAAPDFLLGVTLFSVAVAGLGWRERMLDDLPDGPRHG